MFVRSLICCGCARSSNGGRHTNIQIHFKCIQFITWKHWRLLALASRLQNNIRSCRTWCSVTRSHTTHLNPTKLCIFLFVFCLCLIWSMMSFASRRSNARSVTSHFASFFVSFSSFFSVAFFPFSIFSWFFQSTKSSCDWELSPLEISRIGIESAEKRKHEKKGEKKLKCVNKHIEHDTAATLAMPLNRLKRYNQIQSRSLAHAAKRWVSVFFCVYFAWFFWHRFLCDCSEIGMEGMREQRVRVCIFFLRRFDVNVIMA